VRTWGRIASTPNTDRRLAAAIALTRPIASIATRATRATSCGGRANGALRPRPVVVPYRARMTDASRFELKLSAGRRRELAELADEAEMSSADLVRLSIGWLLQNPGVLLPSVVARRMNDHTGAGK
jgi:aryl-alcohol dehydrogenase-like predicted oxidoreductase